MRLPFVDTPDKAYQAVRQINHTGELEGKRPLVFTTLVDMEVLGIIRDGCKGMLLDMFGMFVQPIEQELGIKSHHRVGRFSDASKSQAYHDRIEAINFSLAHDDGQSNRDLEGADVILVGVSRSGKTPTSLYLAMQHGLKAANYPLIPEDFERRQLPPALAPFKNKLFGLTINPERLAEIRSERRPGSRYASLPNCRSEVADAEAYDAPCRHPLALHHHQEHRGNRHHHPAGNTARAAQLLSSAAWWRTILSIAACARHTWPGWRFGLKS